MVQQLLQFQVWRGSLFWLGIAGAVAAVALGVLFGAGKRRRGQV
jgi:hypothetical protein